MTASKYVKANGVKSLAVVSAYSGRCANTLTGWYNRDRKLFDVILMGVVAFVKNPYNYWLKPEMLVAAEYVGAAVIKTLSGRTYAVRVLPGGFFDYNTGAQFLIEDIVEVMAYDEELGR